MLRNCEDRNFTNCNNRIFLSMTVVRQHMFICVVLEHNAAISGKCNFLRLEMLTNEKMYFYY